MDLQKPATLIAKDMLPWLITEFAKLDIIHIDNGKIYLRIPIETILGGIKK